MSRLSVDVLRELANQGSRSDDSSVFFDVFRRMPPHPHSASCTTSLTVPLSIKMPRNLSNLRIDHLNVTGLERHINRYHFFATTETKLKLSSPVGRIRVPCYNLIRHKLSAGRGQGRRVCGGIGLYIQKGVKAVPFLKSTHDPDLPPISRFELLAVRTRLNDLNICVVVVYNPSCYNPNFSNNYKKLLLNLLEHDFDRIYVVRDFNVNVAATLPSANLSALPGLHLQSSKP